MLTHGTLLHKDSDTLATLVELFQEQGINTLTHNLSLGIDNRQGLYDCMVPHRHKHADALGEIGAWLHWLGQQGVDKVALLGHSRGGNQVAWFAAERDEAMLKALILLGPSTRSYETSYIQRDIANLKRAEALAVNERATVSVLISTNFLFCKNTFATPAAFLSYYAPEPRRDTPYLLPLIHKPVLVITASEDQIVPDVVDEIVTYNHTELTVIDGADHFFRDLYADEVVEKTIQFLEQRTDFK